MTCDHLIATQPTADGAHLIYASTLRDECYAAEMTWLSSAYQMRDWPQAQSGIVHREHYTPADHFRERSNLLERCPLCGTPLNWPELLRGL